MLAARPLRPREEITRIFSVESEEERPRVLPKCAANHTVVHCSSFLSSQFGPRLTVAPVTVGLARDGRASGAGGQCASRCQAEPPKAPPVQRGLDGQVPARKAAEPRVPKPALDGPHPQGKKGVGQSLQRASEQGPRSPLQSLLLMPPGWALGCPLAADGICSQAKQRPAAQCEARGTLRPSVSLVEEM